MSNYKHHFLFGKKNFIIAGIGTALIIAGFIAMIGGGSAPDLTKTYPEDTLYGFKTTVLAPILVLAGLGLQIYSIFARSNDTEGVEDDRK